MINRKGDMFTTELSAIGHGVNCVGVMGAGIAKPIKDKFPNNYANYAATCRAGALQPGQVFTCVENHVTIFNMATQHKPGRDARYDAVFGSALRAAETAVEMGLDSIAIPMIGCGIGGLEWSNVAVILDAVEFILNDDKLYPPKFEWEVWKL